MKRILLIVCLLVWASTTVWALYYATPYVEYGEDCATIAKGNTPFSEDAVYPVQGSLKNIPSYYLIIDNGVVREKTAEEKTAYDTIKARTDSVNALIADPNSGWTEDDRAELMAMDDEAFAQVVEDAQDADEAARQAAKSIELKTAENNFLNICDGLSGGTNHVRLGFAELEVYINAIQQWDARTDTTVKLLAVNSELQRTSEVEQNVSSGLLWWDDCVWHPEIVTNTP